MKSLSAAHLIGRVGREPELRYTPDGQAVTTLSVATDRPGGKEDAGPDWHRCVLFGRLAHALGLKVIMAPAMDLGYVPGSVSPRVAGETIVHWYLRANIAGAAAASGDIVNIQGESQTTILQQYDALYNAGAAQARTANPSVKVFDEVSTVNGTAQQMAAAAESITGH